MKQKDFLSVVNAWQLVSPHRSGVVVDSASAAPPMSRAVRKRFCRPGWLSLFIAFMMAQALLFLIVIPVQAQATAERDILREIFTSIGSDGIEPEDGEESLPYKDGAQLRSVRQPVYGSYSISSPSGTANSVVTSKKVTGVFGVGGKLAAPLTAANGYKLEISNKMPTLPAIATVGGKQYSMELLTILNSYEGDFDGDGKRDELAFIIGARTKGTGNNHSDLLLLCVGDASLSSDLTVVSVLYEGPANGPGLRFRHRHDWISRTALVCADMDGDGVDEIAAVVPVNKFSQQRGIADDGFVKQTNLMIWKVDPAQKGTNGWAQTEKWQAPKEINATHVRDLAGLGAYIGAVGTTLSIAAGDIDRDGREDVVLAISCLNAPSEYRGADSPDRDFYHSIVTLYGEKDLSKITENSNLPAYLSAEGAHVSAMYYRSPGIWGGSSGGYAIGLALTDMDGAGNLSVLVAYKRVWDLATINVNTPPDDPRFGYFSAPEFYVYCADYNGERKPSAVSLVHKGPLSFSGNYSGTNHNLHLKCDNPVATAAMKIAGLRYDYGRRAASSKEYIVSSGSFVLDGVIFSFVKYLKDKEYIFDTRYEARVVPEILDPNNTTNSQNGYDLTNDFFDYETWSILEKVWKGAVENKQYIYDLRSASVNGESDGFIIVRGNGRNSALPIVEYFDATSTGGTKRGYEKNKYISKEEWSFPSSASLGSGSWASERAVFSAFPDLDGKSVYLKYNNQHAFFWADPVIVAALASPPYFKALPSDQWLNSSTSYGKTTSSSQTTTSSYTTTAGTIIATEVSAGILGIGGSWQTETEHTKAMTKGAEKSKEVSQTHTFTTIGGENMVVLATAAFDAYAYTMYYLDPATGKSTSAPFNVIIPRGGETAIKVVSVNYDDYEAMRPYAQGELPDLSKVFNHTLGKPETYMSNSSNISVPFAPGSKLESDESAYFVNNSGNQALSIEITKEKTAITSTAWSVNTKMGGGFEAEGEFLDLFNIGSSVSVSDVYGEEEEYGKIRSNSVGVIFEGVVHGQADGINPGGSGQTKGDFAWKLLRYVYSNRAQASKSNGKISLQEFPVVTYMTSGVVQPSGVSPSSVRVTNIGSGIIEQVGPKTPDLKNSAAYTVTADGVIREARTELLGAPLGMTLNTGGSNIGVSTPFPFSVGINGNVQPGTYDLQLEVGGVSSNTFSLMVKPYTIPPTINLEMNKPEIDFGRVRYNYEDHTEQTTWVTLHNNSTISAENLEATLGSSFEFTDGTSFPATLEKNGTTDIFIRPKAGLPVGIYKEELLVYNEEALISIPIVCVITPPTVADVPLLEKTGASSIDPDEVLNLTWKAPEDDGGTPVTGYEVFIYSSHYSEGSWSYNTILLDTVADTYFNFTPPDYGRYGIMLSSINMAGTGNGVVFSYYVEEVIDYDGVVLASQKAGNTQLEFSWREVEGETPAGYETKIDDGEWLRNVTTYTDDFYPYSVIFMGLKNGQSYDVSIRAYYADETTGPESNYTGIPDAGMTAPVKNLKADERDGHVILTWDAPNEGHHSYYVRTDNGYYYSKGGNTFRTDMTGLTNGQTYKFSVIAYPYGRENNPWHATHAYAIATPQAGLPDEPDEVTNKTVRIDNDGTVRISWDAPDDDGGSEVLGYEIGVNTDVWGEQRWESPSANNEHTFYNVPQNNDYYHFWLRAINAVGPGYAKSVSYTTLGMSGNKTLSVPVGYADTDAGEYTITHSYSYGEVLPEEEDPEPAVIEEDWFDEFDWSIKSADDAAITWDNTERKIKIASGLAPGEYKAVLQATNKMSNTPNWMEFSLHYDFNFTLIVCDVPAIATESLPAGLVDVVYNAMALVASGGGAKWSIVDGALPTGLALTEDGAITGVPIKAGTFTFTVKVENEKGSITKQLSLTISKDNAPTQAFTVVFNVIGANGTLISKVDNENIASDDLVMEGKTVIFTATPAQGYRVKAWTDNNAGVNGKAAIYTILNIADDHDITVEFEEIPTGVETVQATELQAYVKNGLLHVIGLTPGEEWLVYDIAGVQVYQNQANSDEASVNLPVQGMYIVKSGNKTVKVVYR